MLVICSVHYSRSATAQRAADRERRVTAADTVGTLMPENLDRICTFCWAPAVEILATGAACMAAQAAAIFLFCCELTFSLIKSPPVCVEEAAAAGCVCRRR